MSEWSQGGTNYFNAREGKIDLPETGKNHSRQMAKYYNALDSRIALANAERIFASRFKWGGDDIKHYLNGYIENLLFYSGFCIAFSDDELGNVICAATIADWSATWQPTEFNAILKGYKRKLNIKDCVVIQDNSYWFPQIVQAQRDAGILADMRRGIEIYANGLKKPVIITTTDKDALTSKSVAEQMANNQEYIFYTPKKRKGNREDPFIQVDKTPHTASDLNGMILARHTLQREMYAMMGIGGASSAKTQYTNKDETDNQDDFADILYSDCQECREKAVENMKEKLGWDISVETGKKEITEEEEALDEPNI